MDTIQTQELQRNSIIMNSNRGAGERMENSSQGDKANLIHSCTVHNVQCTNTVLCVCLNACVVIDNNAQCVCAAHHYCYCRC